jgi:hypothetical protein
LITAMPTAAMAGSCQGSARTLTNSLRALGAGVHLEEGDDHQEHQHGGYADE